MTSICKIQERKKRNYKKALEWIKLYRFPCPFHINGKHHWISYHGQDKQVCHDCDYPEDIVVKVK